MQNRHDSGTTETPEQIIEHISRLMAEAEAMLAGPVSEKNAENQVRDLKYRLGEARDKMGRVYTRARSNVIAGARYTDQTIRDYPYYSIGLALGVGVLVGFLVGRSTSQRPQLTAGR